MIKDFRYPIIHHPIICCLFNRRSNMFYWSALKRMSVASLLLACLWLMIFWALGTVHLS
jgi:hypothetical protein